MANYIPKLYYQLTSKKKKQTSNYTKFISTECSKNI